jgi:DNA-binding CsgD family transcriptional regulator
VTNPFDGLASPLARRPGDVLEPIKVRKTRAVSKRQSVLPNIPNQWGLTALQCEVLRLTVLGLSQNEVAAELCINFKTVATHLARVRDRMGVNNTTQAALLWDRHFRDATEPATTSIGGDKVRVYLAGPMTGLPDKNYPAFHRFAASLRASGYEVVSPAEIHAVGDVDWITAMRADIAQIVTCSHIALMPGYEKSRGASLEAYIANNLGMRPIYLTTEV